MNLQQTMSSMDKQSRNRPSNSRTCALRTLTTLLVTLYAAIAAAQELPSAADIERQIDSVQARDVADDAKKKASLKALELALARLRMIAAENQRAREYEQALTDAPTRQSEVRAKLADHEPVQIPERLHGAALSDVQGALLRQEVTLASLQSRAAEIRTAITNEQDFVPQEAIEDAREGSLEYSDTLDLSTASQDVRDTLTAVNQRYKEAQLNALKQRQISRNVRLSLLNDEAELLDRDITDAMARIAAINRLIADHRQSEARRALALARNERESLGDETPEVRALADETVELAAQWLDVVNDHDATTQQLETTSRQVRRLQDRHNGLARQLDVVHLEASPEFGRAIRQMRDQLSDIDDTRETWAKYEAALTRARFEQFRIDELTDTHQRRDDDIPLLTNNGATAPETGSDERSLVVDLMAEKWSTTDNLSAAYSDYINLLSRVSAEHRKLVEESIEYANLLDQHLLWIPSADVIGAQTMAELGTAFEELLEAGRWSNLRRLIAAQSLYYWLAAFAFATAFVFVLWRRKNYLTALANSNERVGKVNRDSLSFTINATAQTALLALPFPLALFSAAALIGRSNGLASTLIIAAAAILVLEFLRQAVRPDGLASCHFKQESKVSKALFENLRWFNPVFTALFALTVWISFQSPSAAVDGLARLVFIAVCIVVSAAMFRILAPDGRVLRQQIDRERPFARRLSFALLIVLPLVIAALSAYGHHYTAIQIAAKLLLTAAIVLIGVLLYFIAQRAFAIRERRLALKRVKAKRAAAVAQSEDREAAQAAGEGVPDTVDLQEIDRQSLSRQTKALLRMVAFIAVGFALWPIWAELLPAFEPLNNIALWGADELVDGVPIASAITIFDLVLAAGIAIVTYLAAKNLPGLLDVAILSRLTLETGSSYAITTIIRYLVVITGSLVVLQLLGAQWSKLQWLIAALGVGLGFGLQEIVANFVSGIVLLFERPIRIGDTVTVGEQWGTVSRIRIRATTIVDWDRREIVIPNKTFITERLINWTLTDQITRTTIDVGVAYGSDVELTEKLLLEVAAANSRVLDDPQPVALFRKFGDSSLGFQLRIFVQGVRDLIPVTHDLHMAINRVFKENDIVIAFPQRDLRLESGSIDVRLVDSAD